jgi:hypothetical protein
MTTAKIADCFTPTAFLDRIARRGHSHGSGLGKIRWVVERTHAWLHAYRRLRVCYERRAGIHEAFLQIACFLICWRPLKRFSQTNFLMRHKLFASPPRRRDAIRGTALPSHWPGSRRPLRWHRSPTSYQCHRRVGCLPSPQLLLPNPFRAGCLGWYCTQHARLRSDE